MSARYGTRMYTYIGEVRHKNLYRMNHATKNSHDVSFGKLVSDFIESAAVSLFKLEATH